MESRRNTDGERKTITALFADLKGSTALIEGLDPEEARAIIDPALQLMMDAVHRYDGYVAQALGDGIFALFGAPIAHEDHPQRALYAALRMQEEMRGYSDQSRLKGGIPLQMRVGVNTGEVVVRSIRKDDLHTDYVPVGHSTNLAARMEQLATPGSIVISEYTRKLVEGYFDLKALGAAELKGVEEPLNVYEVTGVGQLRTRLQVSARRGLTRFVGRHTEMDQMQRALERAKAGSGQIVGVMGEPGLGKSRLFYEFKQTSQSGCLVLEAFAVSHGKSSPYLPLIELLKEYFQIESQDDERQRRAKIMGHVLALDKSLEGTLPYLLAILGIGTPDASIQQMDAQIRRQRTFDALKNLFLRESLNQPLMLVFEDLHWIDSETQGFLDTLSESVASAPLLLLVNYRPEYRHEWGSKTYYTQLRLAPLGKAEAEEFLSFLLGNDVSLSPLKPLILDKTEGTPFFMEEVVQTLAEEDALLGERGNYRLEETSTELQIPATVQGILASRIDRLTESEKDLLQHLAVIGRQFPISLIKRVVAQSEDELYRVLSSLQAKEFLYEQPAFPEVEYVFKHALTQDVAYGTVLQEQRKVLHERIGQTLEELYTENISEHYSELAHHYRHSDNAEKAVEYLGLAGQQAVAQSANVEAVSLLTMAVDCLKSLPETPDRTRQELDLLVALGAPLGNTLGFAASQVKETYTRAHELCQHLNESAQLPPVLWGLLVCITTRGEMKAGRELAESLYRLTQQTSDPYLRSQGHYMLGAILLWLGEPQTCYDHMQQGLAVYESRSAEMGEALAYGWDPGVACFSYAALSAWVLGYPTRALTYMRQAVGLAQEGNHSANIAFAMMLNLFLAHFCGDQDDIHEQSEAIIAYCDDHGLPFGIWGQICGGLARVQQGQRDVGMARLHQGLTTMRELEQEWGSAFGMALLAKAHAASHQVDDGLVRVTDAWERMVKTSERWYEPELCRLKGELILQQCHVHDAKGQGEKEAEECFQRALDVAQKQSAKSWELRAATSLARLWQQQGKTTEARDLLALVYNWFTEGLDTKDLIDAKALLEELAS